MNFDRKKYFDSVRPSLFSGSMSQDQVEGQEAILGEWELPQVEPAMTDLRWLAYSLATTYHETSKEMQPIEEYGHGSGQPYGATDPETGQKYFGRGFVQLTWRDNYRKATQELGLKGESDLEWHADMALDPQVAADVMFQGMKEGWFRKADGTPNNYAKYFNDSRDDPYEAREIINGDKKTVPSWSNGVSIGNLIKGYHQKFLTALQASKIEDPQPEPEPEPEPDTDPATVDIDLNVAASEGAIVTITINGERFI